MRQGGWGNGGNGNWNQGGGKGGCGGGWGGQQQKGGWKGTLDDWGKETGEMAADGGDGWGRQGAGGGGAQGTATWKKMGGAASGGDDSGSRSQGKAAASKWDIKGADGDDGEGYGMDSFDGGAAKGRGKGGKGMMKGSGLRGMAMDAGIMGCEGGCGDGCGRGCGKGAMKGMGMDGCMMGGDGGCKGGGAKGCGKKGGKMQMMKMQQMQQMQMMDAGMMDGGCWPNANTGGNDSVFEAVSMAMKPLYAQLGEGTIGKSEKRLRDAFKKGAKGLAFQAKPWWEVINDYADAAFSSVFASCGDQDWLTAVDLSPAFMAGVSDNFPAEVINCVSPMELEPVCCMAFERAWEEQRALPVMWDIVQAQIDGPKAKKKVFAAIEAGWKEACMLPGYFENELQDFVWQLVDRTIGHLGVANHGEPQYLLEPEAASAFFNAIIDGGAVPFALVERNGIPPSGDPFIDYCITEAYAAHVVTEDGHVFGKQMPFGKKGKMGGGKMGMMGKGKGKGMAKGKGMKRPAGKGASMDNIDFELQQALQEDEALNPPVPKAMRLE